MPEFADVVEGVVDALWAHGPLRLGALLRKVMDGVGVEEKQVREAVIYLILEGDVICTDEPAGTRRLVLVGKEYLRARRGGGR